MDCAKAEGDFAVARRERRARKSPNFDALCFHAQQGVEKWMKAILIHLQEIPPRTHDLLVLSERLSKACPAWFWPHEELRLVSRATVTYRYPGETATRNEAGGILRLAERMRRALKALLKSTA